ncbi:hypothetical protein P8864_04545 [Priestia flexa]|uniref:hypothetical protein n=1 Tax=Priestia flexa TaxID=86664 RepID=UPI000C2436CF|nr:hypothetical protein [Priestia flexa]MEC0665211.1 hypothetical protein [Priestia flexa]MED3825101.1 hypothetical protein [Priestia flexa]
MGFIGVVTTDTNDFVLANSREEVMITDEVNAINKSVKQLKEQGIRSIVVLAHVSVQSDQNGGNPKEDLAEMAYKVDDEVDVMLGAHNHQYANTVVDDKLLVQAYSYGKAFSQVELGIDKRTEEIAYKQAEIVPVEHESVKPDPKVMTFLQTYKDQLGTDAGKSIGTLPYQLTRKKMSELSRQEGGDGFSKLTSTKVLQKGPLIVDAVAMHFEDSYPLVVQK